MDVVVDIFYAIFFFSIGFLLIKYRRNVKSWTWNFVWAERYLWHGGTYFVMLLLGCFLMVLWVLYPFWGLELMFWVDENAPKEFKMK